MIELLSRWWLRSGELDGLVQDDGAEDLQGDGEGGDTGGVVEALACHG